MRIFTRFTGRPVGKLFPLMLWSALGLALPWNSLQAAIIPDPPGLMSTRYYTSPVGGSGGTPFLANCDSGSGEMLVGIEGKSSAVVDRIGPLCVQVDGTGRWLGEPATTYPLYGGSGGSPFRLQCPANTAVSGIKGRAGNLVDQLRIYCGPMGANGSLQSVGSLLPGQAGGGGGNAFGPHYCIENKPGIGITGRAGVFVDGIRLACDLGNPPRLKGIDFDPYPLTIRSKRVKAEKYETIYVDLNVPGVIDISLRSSNPLVAEVPSTTRLTKRLDKSIDTSFLVQGKAAGCTRIEASYLGDKYNADLLVDGPSSPQMSMAFSTDPSADPWPLGRAVTATLTIPAAAPAGGRSIVLGSSHPQVAPVPNSVLIPAGSRTISFDIVPRNPSPLGDCIVFTAIGNDAEVKRVGVVPGTLIQPTRPKIP